MKNKNQSQPTEHEILKLRDYLRAFSGRLLLLTGSFVVAAIIGFEFKEIIQGLLTMQLDDLNLMNLQSANDVQSTVLISLFTAVLVGLPFALYHTYRFVEPIFHRGTIYAFKLVTASSMLIIASVLFSFMVTIPLALHGMATQGQDALLAHVSTQSFLNFAIGQTLAIVMLSQLPLAIIFANGVASFSTKKVMIIHAITIPVILVLGWITTPATTFNRSSVGMLFVILPSLVLFEASMVWARFHQKTDVAEAQKEATMPAEKFEHIQQMSDQEDRLVTTEAPVLTVASAVDEHTLEPESLFDAMLRDHEQNDPQFSDERVPLPPSLDVDMEEPEPARPIAASGIEARVAHHMQPQAVSVMPHRPAVVVAPITSVKNQAFAAAPRFRQSMDMSRRPFQASLRQQSAVQKPMTQTLKPQPVLRNLHAPQQTIPFQAQATRRYGNGVEGLFAA